MLPLGNRWQGNDNTLTLKPIERPARTFPWKGLSIHTKSTLPAIPSNGCGWFPMPCLPSNGMVFEKASIAIDIIENHWIPRNLSNSEGIRWPMGKDIHLLLLPNGMGGINAIGYGGVNRYDGPASISTGQISINPLPITGKTGEDTNFENLFFQRLQEASHFVQVEKDMFFYKTTVPLAAFNAQLFNLLVISQSMWGVIIVPMESQDVICPNRKKLRFNSRAGKFHIFRDII